MAVAFLAVCTLFALVPPRRPPALALIGFRLGFLVNELPFLAGYLLIAVTLLAFGVGTVDSAVGWTAFGLAVLTAIGLVVVIRRGLRARPAVEDALRAGLGADWRGAIDAGLAARLRRRLPLARILFRPLFVRRREVERIANIGYGEAGCVLDLYRRRDHPSGGPVLVQLHGGPHTDDRKDGETRPLIYRLASQGWVCLSANFRLHPAAAFPDHLVDVKKVIAWVREHGPEYGADPATVFVAGSSSGAHLAALAALTPNDPAFQPGFEPADTSVAAAICLYGHYGRLDTPRSSPADHVGSAAPPFFVAHGGADSMISAEHARRFVETLRHASTRPVVHAELPGGQHTFDLFRSVRFEIVVDAAEAFAAWVRSGRV